MLVRKYTGRSHRRNFPDAGAGDKDPLSSSQDAPFSSQGIPVSYQDEPFDLPFSFQDSSQLSFGLDVPEERRKRKEKRAMAVTTTTLMKAQEFGEMMEPADEVNFVLDG